MKHGADVFANDNLDRNVLQCLTETSVEHLELAKILIEKGVSLHDYCDLHLQPLHSAVMMGKYESVKLYLDHGADVNAQSLRGKTPLHLALEPTRLKLPIIETLLKRGANTALKTGSGGWTALHYACSYIQREVVKLFLAVGADVLVENDYGQTPLACIPHERMESPGVELIIKVLALKKALQPSLELKDEGIIERYPKLRIYYRSCFEEIDRMRSTRFTEGCTFFDLLAKSQRQIAGLMRSPDFEAKFQLYDLSSEFTTYAEEAKRSFELGWDRSTWSTRLSAAFCLICL
ncbi:putative ankyrin repeat protein RF_0381 [Nasonia vitripennis]|uniref:Uncharacterized protein n=1 Tax=Nasonia vitripennis TaxID=7425 RepID=A0A7M7HC00_NASVI|nr:putative ankyrin repeat protein RF_0381 [Nasonia vitripennis]